MREYLTDKLLNSPNEPDRTPNPLIEEFKESEEYRYAYADEHLNTTIALQIRALREQREMTQSDLAKEVGTQQPGIARLENVNYSRWNTETLKKIARALGVRLKITFETFGTLLEEDDSFSRESLQRPKFEDDPAFKEEAEPITAQQLEAHKVASINEFITRPEFVARYGSLDNTAFVDALIQTSGLASHPLRDAWIGILTNGVATRAQVLRAFAESREVELTHSQSAYMMGGNNVVSMQDHLAGRKRKKQDGVIATEQELSPNAFAGLGGM